MRRFITLLALLGLCLAALLPASPALAQSGDTWQVFYFNNTNWQGSPAYFQYASSVNFNWGSDTPPGPNMPAQNWTARLTANVFFYAGIYRFQVQADDDFALYIDNALYADTRGANLPGKAFTIDIPLSQGNHYIDIEYRQFTGPAYLFANWTFAKSGNPQPPPPQPQPPAPPAANQPFPAPPSLATDYGDYTSCAQQRIHQQNCFQSNGAWNAPNLGSIQMEPQIVRWERCTPDQVQSIQLYTNQPAQTAKCSKTEAGWFPA
jgi:hypothetical protein